MRTIRIYQPGPYAVGESLELSATASQHVGVVLRMQPDDELTLFSGENSEFSAKITNVQKKKVTVTLIAEHLVHRESPRHLHLAQAISKGDRMEWVIQKAVELGVTSITPLFTTHCVVKLDAERLAKKQLQWQAIAIAACEQSGRTQVPVIHPARSLNDYLSACDATMKLALHPYAAKSWRDYTFSAGSIALLIGPEGGLSDEEVSLAHAHDFQSLCLGPRVLRTETAAVVALSVLQALAGDL